MAQWITASVSKTGLSHQENHTECQDRVRIYHDGNITAALADGVGSLSNSAYAAEYATDYTVEWFRENRMQLAIADDPLEVVRRGLIPTISEKIRHSAEQSGLHPRTLDCNLVFVYILTERNGAICGRLGDGAVCIMADRCEAMCAPVGSANRTDTVLYSRAVDCLQLKWIPLTPDILGFMLTSDGLDDVLYMKGQNFVRKTAEPFFNAAQFDNPQGRLNQLVQKLTDDCPSYDDDISVAVISRAEKAIELETDPTWLCSCGHRNELHWNTCTGQRCRKSLADVYEKYSFDEFGGKYGFFRHYNRLPDKERMLVGLLPQIEERDNPELRDPVKAYEPERTMPIPQFPFPQQKPDAPLSSVSEDTQEAPRVEASQPARPKTMPMPTVPPIPSIPPVQPSRQMASPIPAKRTDKPLVPTIPIGIGADRQDAYSQTVAPENTMKSAQSENREKAAPAEARKQISVFRPDKLKKLPFMWIALLLCVVLLVGSAASLWSVRKHNEQLKERIAALENENNAGGVISLEDGSEYYGSVRNGKPHGNGILLADGKYWIGSFSNGEKNGWFLIVDEADVQDSKLQYYRNGKVTQNQGNAESASLEITERYVVLRDAPDASGENIAELKKGDVVYPLGEPTEVDGILWIQVAVDPEIGPAGWCRVSQTSYEAP